VTDEVDLEWKQVLIACVKVTCALSPQAKGKVERPYGWLQDRIVRTCAREGRKEIRGAREVLRYETDRYNKRCTVAPGNPGFKVLQPVKSKENSVQTICFATTA